MDTDLEQLKPGERLDDLQRSGLKIIQNPEKFCFGMDAVLLSGFAGIKKGEVAVDIGTGTGIIPLLLSAKTYARHFTGIEIQEYMADMARRSVLLNKLENRISIINKDIKQTLEEIPSGSIDVVTSNPPYIEDRHGLQNIDSAVAIARHEIKCSLDDVLKEAARMLRNGGRLYMVYRPHRFAELIYKMKENLLEPKRVRFVHPFTDKEANMVLVEACKNGGRWLKAESPLIVYENIGKYTEEIINTYGY